MLNIEILYQVVNTFANLQHVFSDQFVVNFLFNGKIRATHKTKFAIEKFFARYAESIDNLNRAIIVSVAFVPIALLPAGQGMKIPLIDLQVTSQNWLRLGPAISYGLQFFTLLALFWFLLLRRGLAVLEQEVGNEIDHFGDVSNIMLTGPIGNLWLFGAIREHLPSKLHLFWFLPLGFLLVFVIFSPSILCAYFVRDLFASKDLIPAFIYSVLLVPSVALALVLIGLSIVVGIPIVNQAKPSPS